MNIKTEETKLQEEIDKTRKLRDKFRLSFYKNKNKIFSNKSSDFLKKWERELEKEGVLKAKLSQLLTDKKMFKDIIEKVVFDEKKWLHRTFINGEEQLPDMLITKMSLKDELIKSLGVQ